MLMRDFLCGGDFRATAFVPADVLHAATGVSRGIIGRMPPPSCTEEKFKTTIVVTANSTPGDTIRYDTIRLGLLVNSLFTHSLRVTTPTPPEKCADLH